MKISMTPSFRLGRRFNPITPDIGSMRMYKSLKILKYPKANVVFKTGDDFFERKAVNC